MNIVLNNIKKKIPELSYSQIENVFYLLVNENLTNLSEIIKNTGIASNTLKDLISSTNGLLKLNGEKIDVAESLQNTIFEKAEYPIDINDLDLENKLDEIRKRYSLNPKREFDQFFATNNTSIKKALILQKSGLLKNNNIAILGDDDFVSVVLTLKYKFEVTVFETDTEMINKLKTIAKDYNLKINLVEFNAKNKIPPQFANKFDIVLTDPPYTDNGVELFLDRCISLLVPFGHIFLNYGNSLKTLEKYVRIQEIFNKYNLFIKNCFYNFNQYNGASSIGSNSSLYILQSTPATKVSNVTFENIYTFEERDLLKFPYSATYSFKVTKVDTSLLYSRSKIDELAKKFAKAHTLKIVDESIHKFNNTGFTFNYTLSASSLVIHTWPEYKAMHILVDVCSKVKNEMLMVETLAKLFNVDINDISFKKYL